MSAKRKYDEIDQQTFDDGDKNKKKVVINSLDYDSLAQIISLLPIPEIILMEEVCTKWKEASQLAWYDIKKYKCESSIRRNCYDVRLLTQSYLEKILLRCKCLRRLSLSDICDSSIMPFVGDHCKNLTSLECKFPANTLNNNADDFVQAFTQLDKLKCIKIITINDKPLDETLDLFRIINSLPEEINEIHMISEAWVCKEKKVSLTFKKFKNLKKLTLHGCSRFLDSIILQEIAEKTTLVYLNIRLHDIPERFFLFDKLVNLEYINLTLVTYPSSSFCGIKNNLSTKVLNTIFCTCKNLKHLEMPPALYDIAEIPFKKWINFQNLEYLGISCNNIMPDLANTIVEYCKNLKHLRLHYPYHCRINEAALKKLTELENLESLILLFYMKISEESIIAISNNCKKLRVLEIPNCYLVPSIDGEPLSSPSVFDELSKLQYLEHLNVAGPFHYRDEATYLEDSTIIAIANNCKNLNILHIKNQKAITETALVALTNLENLQQLDVSYLNIITDDFIIKLKGLKTLNCSYCPKLTNVGIIQFIKNNPDLEQMCVLQSNIATDLVIAADQATKNRTNGIILQLSIDYWFNREFSARPIIKSQWLIVKYIRVSDF
ncbi:hypothetical protein HCN44_010014 [Aphidius gifuensis]|uniref:Uncharacterized protein n=1 Tax=Aphidius gifuensis TaxID=684658 RepID=A0A834XVS4_APHGI|nr:hypothetical protein HCN44_010014 [Aphidius gifuensis]